MKSSYQHILLFLLKRLGGIYTMSAAGITGQILPVGGRRIMASTDYFLFMLRRCIRWTSDITGQILLSGDRKIV